jgi:hypothetical protein
MAMDPLDIVKAMMELWDEGVIISRHYTLNGSEAERLARTISAARRASKLPSPPKTYGKRRTGMNASEIRYPGRGE